MRKSVSAIGLLSLLFVFGAKAEAQLNLASMDWSVKAPHNLAKEPPSRKVVEEFLQLGDDNANSPSLCSFTFADLRRNGTLTLLYASDSSGRGFCNEIEMVDRTGATFELSNLDTSEAFGDGDDVRKLVKDLDN
ncbi:MAG TPA: hypothetical protein VMU41_01775, partial [Candidatus Binataceae bacterium]|nr:hypothetical protein [Candidatus Binataceae bacterium]